MDTFNQTNALIDLLKRDSLYRIIIEFIVNG